MDTFSIAEKVILLLANAGALTLLFVLVGKLRVEPKSTAPLPVIIPGDDNVD